ncbi:nuclease-related domain-containing protein [Macrococcus equi]|uniref:nuclease-related domain-containing protein n=1 Tax=Macrococcus equi TaxID=3395462 RepID=UPI0039BDD187
MIQPPRIVVLEDILKRRLNDFEYSEEYHRSYYGYVGEKQFLKEFPIEDKYIQLFNLCIEFNGQSFEIDRLVLTGNKLFAFDVKNYFGSYEYDELIWRKSGFSLKNPQAQFINMHETFSAKIDWMDVGHEVVSKMIFINKGFSINKKIHDMIQYYDIGKIMKEINECEPAGELERDMAAYFKKKHKPIRLHERRPEFNFDDIRIGVQCSSCSLEHEIDQSKKKTIVCKGCLKRMNKVDLIRENLIELEVLLNRPFSITEANRWVGRAHRNRTKFILENNFKKCDRGYYYFENYYKHIK